MEGLQYDYFGLFPVGRPLVRWRHDFRGAPEMAQGTAKAIYKDVQSVRLDSKLLQAAHPDIYAECSKRTTYKRFSVV